MSASERLPWKSQPLRELLRLAWPLVLSMLSLSVATVVDTAFVGSLGGAALAAVSVGGVVCFTLLAFGIGLVRSVKVLMSQARGAGDAASAPVWELAGVLVALGFGIFVIAIAHLFAPTLPRWVNGAEAGALAGDYLRVRSLSAPFVLVGAALREARYAVGETRAPTLSALATNAALIGIEAIFVLGFGLGVTGAAWAHVSAQALGALGMLVVARGVFGAGATLRWGHVALLLKTGAPLGLQMVLEVGAFAALVVVLATLGQAEVAAHQIALQVVHLSFLPAFALGEAASVLTGQAVGADEDELVPRLATLAWRVALAYTLGCGLLFWLTAPLVARAFTTDAAVIAAAVRLIHVAALFQIADGANVVARSVLRGAGDVRVPALLSVATAWVCTPLFGWWLGVKLGWGAFGGWLGLSAEIVIGAGLLWWRFWSGGWRSHAARSRAALQRLGRPASDPEISRENAVPAQA